MDNAFAYGYYNYSVYLSMRKPLVIDCNNRLYDSIAYNEEIKDTYEWAAWAEKKGYDGVIFVNIRDGIDFGSMNEATNDYVAFSPSQIKSATDNIGTFDGKNDDIRFRISDKRKADIANKVRSKLTDISEEDIDTLITEIEKLGEANKKRGQEGNVRLENAALHFALQGTIRLPEDNEKVIQAFENAERFHDDITKYKSPEELNAKYAEKIAERERINPDKVKTLSNRQELKDGIVVYDVEDSEQGRRDMRQIINTHFGKDASPWCLLQGDGNGNLTEESGRYWKHYNAFDKRVAFKDGKLLAFFANNDVDRPTWWDGNDVPHNGLPVTRKMDDGSGRTATYEYNEETGEYSNPTNIHKGNRQNGRYEEWHNNGKLAERGNYKDGELEGDYEAWYENGKLAERVTHNDDKSESLYEQWYNDGELAKHINYKDGKRDGLSEEYFDNGKLKISANYKDGEYDGLYEEWHNNGELKISANYKDGKLEGDYEAWYENGKLAERVTHNDDKSESLYEEWYESGQLAYRVNYKNGKKDGVSEWWYNDGKLLRRENFKDGKLEGLREEWGRDGQLLTRQEYKNGELVKHHEVNLGRPIPRRNVRFRKGSELDQVNERFNRELASLTEENADSKVLMLGTPSNVLLSGGVENKPMKLYGNKVIKKMRKHGFALAELNDLPKAVANPIAVFDGATNGSHAILTELKIKENNVLVSLSIGENNDVDFNIVSSVYGKANKGIANWINNGK